MKLIDDWRKCLNKLWTVRIAIFTSLLACADQVLAVFQLYIPPVFYAVLSIAIIVARLVYQPKVHDDS